ncbi:hypothetical protein L2E82_13674 [Cichorium intybus]|uniref:Uncharacterized protein n=1 Tax=Cichorium intybus TaxID=13427 RepID=A0ACB9EXY4_CICIN|nr:hypothetical protein L2E82_13674 [Cichorium intybus]
MKFLSTLSLLPLLITFTSSANSPEISIYHPHQQLQLRDDHDCTTATISTSKHPHPHPPCFQSQTLKLHRPPLPPQHLRPPPPPEEIDPRYGVAKRLVPTGPNPLHH